ncbi:hypothetical protein EV645_4840 [Kribbella rubisoli]|uniref:Uncharacterized protein n=1 Tax=Kribbella rubisoli TaxID=3075929 RepID=A0A4Q7WUL8_9ACTN|nr:hypothetical protein [Kribbella rubisoli]RZU13980.1 hypothetical protein EV645_4840 [Kribbella rubisoli]
MIDRESAKVEVVYIDGDSPAEIFRAAAQWAAENDGGFAGIEALGWVDYGPYENQDGFGLAIYYEPEPTN